ncbi:DUF1588 domain-containing protein, partial [Saccharophagus degradans]|uniref:DUF1592 domain-containing protein n=1 Tax=Saccharophagus degradans TaxID=86304 RepID=UPI001C08B565
TETETENENNSGEPSQPVTPALPAQCTNPQWVSGTEYAVNTLVVNREAAFRCVIAGWCASTANWAYEPNSGLYWEEAWEKVALCSESTSNGNTSGEPTTPNTDGEEQTENNGAETGTENETETETETETEPNENASAPKAVSTVIAVASANQDRIGLSWTDNANNETGFAIRRRTNNGAVVQIHNAPANSTSYTDANVKLDNQYQYDIIAFNAVGSSAAVESNQVSLVTPVTAPNGITNLNATLNNNQIFLSWSQADATADTITIYRTLDDIQWQQLTTVAANTTQYNDTNITTNTTYGYRLVAINTAGESQASNTVHVSVTPIAAGQTLFNQHCAACHSASGIGGDLFSSQTQTAWLNKTLSQLETKISTMPAQQCDADCQKVVADFIWQDKWNRVVDIIEEKITSSGVRGVRLLTPYEYANTIKATLNVTVNSEDLPSARFDSHFKYPSQSSQGLVLTDEAAAYQQLAQDIASKTNITKPTCSTASCKQNAVNNLGLTLFRKPLTAAQTASYSTLFETNGFESVITSMLMSPYFLYLTELGKWDAQTESYRLSNYEIATHLSFSLWGMPPNSTLLSLAATDAFNSDEGVKNQAQTMVNDAKFATHVSEFIRYYANTYSVVDEKPGLSTDVIAAMQQEQTEAIHYLINAGSASFYELLNPSYTYLNSALANHYGLTSTAQNAGSSMQKYNVNSLRGGLLHQGIFQVSNSDFSATSLVKRGKFIRENMLCHMMGTPSGVDPDTITLPEHPITTRERWDVITGPNASNGQCWQCHQLMNEPGSALENYDHAGRYRTEESAANDSSVALTIDASGILRDNSGFNTLTQYADARELSEYLAVSEQALSCFVDNAYRFTSGQQTDAQSEAAINALQQDFIIDGDIKTLFIELASSPAALYRSDRD